MISPNGKVYYFSWYFLNCTVSLHHNFSEDTEAFSPSIRSNSNSWSQDFEEVSFWSHEAMGLVVKQEKLDESEVNKMDDFLSIRGSALFLTSHNKILSLTNSKEAEASQYSSDEIVYYAFCSLLHYTLTVFQSLIEHDISHQSHYWEDYSSVRQNVVSLKNALEEEELAVGSSLQKVIVPDVTALANKWHDAVVSAISSYS